MSLTLFSWPLLVGGIVVLAGIAYAMQRLRAERRVVSLPTAMLWRQAARETPLTVRGSRFRYWLAFLLTLAVLVLLWLAAAHPIVPPSSQGARIFYLDLSAALSGGGDAAAAKRALLADVRATPADRRVVYLGDATATKLLAPGESVSLLAHRLDELRPEARPSGFADWLKGRVATDPGATVRYYGAWPVGRRAVEGSPAAPRVGWGYLAAGRPGNRGIVALGAEPAASGRWSRIDILVELAKPGATAAAFDLIRWRLNGRDFSPGRVDAGVAGRFVLRDVAAEGGLLRATLRGDDGFGADDTAALRLPDRRPVRVAIEPSVPAPVVAAIRSDDAFVIGADRPQVAVGVAGAGAMPDVPTLLLTDPAARPATFTFAEEGGDPDGDLKDRLDELGLGQLDAQALANQLGRPVGVEMTNAPRRSIAVWRNVFDPRGDFAKSATMPLFVTQGVRWLAGVQSWGQEASGIAGGGDGEAPALLDRATTSAMSDAAVPPAVSPIGGVAVPDMPFVTLLSIAILLLTLEWVLYQRGRMP